MCRTPIPHDYLDRPELVEVPEPSSLENGYQWFYEGRNGWWQYDERTSQDLELNYQRGARIFELLIAGNIYVIDLHDMVQYRKVDTIRKRRIKRDMLLHASRIKGIAGLRLEAAEPDLAAVTPPVHPENWLMMDHNYSIPDAAAPLRRVRVESSMLERRHWLRDARDSPNIDDSSRHDHLYTRREMDQQTVGSQQSQVLRGSRVSEAAHRHSSFAVSSRVLTEIPPFLTPVFEADDGQHVSYGRQMADLTDICTTVSVELLNVQAILDTVSHVTLRQRWCYVAQSRRLEITSYLEQLLIYVHKVLLHACFFRLCQLTRCHLTDPTLITMSNDAWLRSLDCMRHDIVCADLAQVVRYAPPSRYEAESADMYADSMDARDARTFNRLESIVNALFDDTGNQMLRAQVQQIRRLLTITLVRIHEETECETTMERDMWNYFLPHDVWGSLARIVERVLGVSSASTRTDLSSTVPDARSPPVPLSLFSRRSDRSDLEAATTRDANECRCRTCTRSDQHSDSSQQSFLQYTDLELDRSSSEYSNEAAYPGTRVDLNETPETRAALNETPGTQIALSEAPRTRVDLNEAPGTQAALNEAPGTRAALNEASRTRGVDLNEAPGTGAALNEAPGTGFALVYREMIRDCACDECSEVSQHVDRSLRPLASGQPDRGTGHAIRPVNRRASRPLRGSCPSENSLIVRSGHVNSDTRNAVSVATPPSCADGPDRPHDTAEAADRQTRNQREVTQTAPAARCTPDDRAETNHSCDGSRDWNLPHQTVEEALDGALRAFRRPSVNSQSESDFGSEFNEQDPITSSAQGIPQTRLFEINDACPSEWSDDTDVIPAAVNGQHHLHRRRSRVNEEETTRSPFVNISLFNSLTFVNPNGHANVATSYSSDVTEDINRRFCDVTFENIPEENDNTSDGESEINAGVNDIGFDHQYSSVHDRRYVSGEAHGAGKEMCYSGELSESLSRPQECSQVGGAVPNGAVNRVVGDHEPPVAASYVSGHSSPYYESHAPCPSEDDRESLLSSETRDPERDRADTRRPFRNSVRSARLEETNQQRESQHQRKGRNVSTSQSTRSSVDNAVSCSAQSEFYFGNAVFNNTDATSDAFTLDSQETRDHLSNTFRGPHDQESAANTPHCVFEPRAGYSHACPMSDVDNWYGDLVTYPRVGNTAAHDETVRDHAVRPVAARHCGHSNRSSNDSAGDSGSHASSSCANERNAGSANPQSRRSSETDARRPGRYESYDNFGFDDILSQTNLSFNAKVFVPKGSNGSSPAIALQRQQSSAIEESADSTSDTGSTSSYYFGLESHRAPSRGDDEPPPVEKIHERRDETQERNVDERMIEHSYNGERSVIRDGGKDEEGAKGYDETIVKDYVQEGHGVGSRHGRLTVMDHNYAAKEKLPRQDSEHSYACKKLKSSNMSDRESKSGRKSSKSCAVDAEHAYSRHSKAGALLDHEYAKVWSESSLIDRMNYLTLRESTDEEDEDL